MAKSVSDEALGLGIDAVRFPALEVLPGETHASLDLFAERLTVLRRVTQGLAKDVAGGEMSDVGCRMSEEASRDSSPAVLVCPIQALMQRVPSPQRLPELSLTIRAVDQRR